ncbi:MAG: hypothetical protein M1839_005398 [Geoglossum umbratile]|nr:MAG: hypothetical protein M1839_005398 [Geoglossum umbratile]
MSQLEAEACVAGDKLTPLHWAAIGGGEVEARELLGMGADVNARSADGWTALHHAAGRGYGAVVQLLLENGADVDAKDDDGCTALQVTAITGQETVARALVDFGATVAAKDAFGWTALHRAARGGHMAVAQLLLEKGADVAKETVQGSTALHAAAENGKEDVARFLLEKGADVAAKDTKGMTALHRTADAAITRRDDNGSTPLHRAVGRGHEAMVRMLLAKGADATARDINGLTPLHVAASGQDRLVMQLLLEKGAQVDAKDDMGHTPLHVAAFRGHEAVVRLLLEKGANVNMQDGQGWTALLSAAVGKHIAVMEALLEGDADILVKDKEGHTALSCMAVEGFEAVAQLLLDAIPGLAQSIDERGLGSIDAKPSTEAPIASVEQQLKAIDIGLHHLCEVCERISFPSLHQKEECTPVGCRYNIGKFSTSMRPFNRERVEAHSLEYKHHSSLDALRTSAEKGCHLCSLIAFGLQHSSERLSIAGRESYFAGTDSKEYGPAQEDGVALVYHKSSEWFNKEELEVFYNGLFTLLPLADIPLKRCSDQGFVEGGWGVGEMNKDFVVRRALGPSFMRGANGRITRLGGIRNGVRWTGGLWGAI